MNLYLEIFGYIGTALVIISMMMTSVIKLRVINMCGSLISLIYAVCVNTWPVAVLNACLLCINFVQTLRQLRHKSDFTELKLDANDLTVQHFLSVNAQDVQKYFPNYRLQAHRETEIHMIYVECEAVGLLVGTRASDVYRIEMDYVVPKYRDISVGKFLFPQLKEQGVNMLTAASASREHDQYLQKLGFREDSGILLRDL
jgi:hypothetical protein